MSRERSVLSLGRLGAASAMGVPPEPLWLSAPTSPTRKMREKAMTRLLLLDHLAHQQGSPLHSGLMQRNGPHQEWS
jgi:hypothetical protein